WGYNARVRRFTTPGMTPSSAGQRDLLIGAGDSVGLGACQPRIDFRGGHRLAEAIALHRMHARDTQKQMLFGGFDTFGGDSHAEAATETDHGMNDGGGVGGILYGAHET